jgi:UPF0176 protein
MFKVVTFYHFIPLEDVAAARDQVKAWATEFGAVGIFLLAPEGVNTTLAGDHPDFTTLIDHLVTLFAVPDENIKWSTAPMKPFKRLKVRLKKEIITLKQGDLSGHAPGTYVAATEWNDVIARPDVTVIDTRNRYETAQGRFDGAVDPGLDHFSDFAAYVDTLDPATTPAVALYCTGGIRCEKASSYMRARGFDQIYQLQGGILRYLEQVPVEESQWQGSCFVFDERIALAHGLETTGDRAS